MTSVTTPSSKPTYDEVGEASEKEMSVEFKLHYSLPPFPNSPSTRDGHHLLGTSEGIGGEFLHDKKKVQLVHLLGKSKKLEEIVLPPSCPHASKDDSQLRACWKQYKRYKPAHFSALS
ncbi:hypothetical protein F2Q68_00016766 [Brassica cretica]|uniref:Uncharacterized protein n=1 Tax=Brassica cretica TaxID=69181 RepID=A0A8S9HDW0_BRACR|nr:hypothetical protein F2Q68_00016766 [Brassica cretica]